MARGAGAWGTVNPTYRRYATVLHFHVDACPPRQPRAKGKVERRVRDQRFALDPRRQAWTDLAELQQWTDARCQRALNATQFGACKIPHLAGSAISRAFDGQLHVWVVGRAAEAAA